MVSLISGNKGVDSDFKFWKLLVDSGFALSSGNCWWMLSSKSLNGLVDGELGPGMRGWKASSKFWNGREDSVYKVPEWTNGWRS